MTARRIRMAWAFRITTHTIKLMAGLAHQKDNATPTEHPPHVCKAKMSDLLAFDKTLWA